MERVNIKPLSVNEAWQGKRFKTLKYKKYFRDLWVLLPSRLEVPKRIHLHIEWGLSSKLADVDNPLKPFIDILQKKYGFDDRQIYKLTVEKSFTEKGKEFVKFKFVEYEK